MIYHQLTVAAQYRQSKQEEVLLKALLALPCIQYDIVRSCRQARGQEPAEAQPAATAQVLSPWAAQAVQGGGAEERRFDMVPQPIMTPKMLRPGCA